MISIVLSSLAAAGLVAVNVDHDLPKKAGWPLIGSLIALGFSIVIQLSKELGIEQKAGQARASADAFLVIEIRLKIALNEDNPTDLVNTLLKEANALWEKYNLVVPRLSNEHTIEAARRSEILIKQFADDWTLQSPRRRIEGEDIT